LAGSGVGAAGDKHLGQPDVLGHRVAGSDGTGRKEPSVVAEAEFKR